MKLTEPECFVQFNDVISASNALHTMDDYRFHAEDTWGITVGYARNVPRSGQTILTIEEEDCVLPEVYVPEPLLQMEQLNLEVEVLSPATSPATSRRGRFAQLLTPGRSASRRRSVTSLSEGSSRRGSVPSVAMVDKKEENRKKKEQKKKEREKERQMMATTDHNVRWGP